MSNRNQTSLARRFATGILAFALVLCAAAVPAAAAAEGVVNINDASVEALQLLPRVGPSVAQRIVDFRTENGKFGDATDLMQVRGIGEKTFELIEPHVTTEGETTLSEKVRIKRTPAPEASSGDGESEDSDAR